MGGGFSPKKDDVYSGYIYLGAVSMVFVAFCGAAARIGPARVQTLPYPSEAGKGVGGAKKRLLLSPNCEFAWLHSPDPGRLDAGKTIFLPVSTKVSASVFEM